MTSCLKVICSGQLLALWVGSAVFAQDLAQVNGRAITDKDLERALTKMHSHHKKHFLKDVNTRAQILQNVVDRVVAAQEAQNLKLDQEPESKALLDQLREQFLMDRLIERKVAPEITPALARKYYESHKEEFNTDTVQVQHILVETQEMAEKILKMIQGDQADFQQLALKYSTDPSVKNNKGDLGFINRWEMVPEFNDVAFTTVEGEIGPIVRTLYGYHLVKVIHRKTGKTLPYEQVSLKVAKILTARKTRSYLDSLRSKSQIQINHESLKKS